MVVLQPGYLPWLGFFDQVRRSDRFVFFDDVQYDRRGWRNRNRIKGENGEPHWLTVPVLHDGVQRILEVEIDHGRPWARTHLRTIRQLYRRAPFVERYLPELEEVLQRPWERLVDLDLAVIQLMCRWLGVESRFVRSSELPVSGRSSDLLLGICRHLGASRYLTGDAARSYLDVDLFAEHGIDVIWQQYHHPVYPQLHGPFQPYLSALDLLLNCGDESGEILAGGAAT